MIFISESFLDFLQSQQHTFEFGCVHLTINIQCSLKFEEVLHIIIINKLCVKKCGGCAALEIKMFDKGKLAVR